MRSTFKYGDKVLVGKHLGKVVSIRDVDGKYICTVKFDDKNLIPSEMDYEERHLKLEYSPDKHCPICGDEYQVVKFNMHVWKDCLTCKDKKENLEKIHADEKYRKSKLNTDFKNTKIPGSYSEQEETLLKEFEKMLDQDDDDEWEFDVF
tara:strand:- start:11965 stop:12411 length:447 start_codon:yes stop_codon:yes gene_type:complete